jgi:hypothetical protein
MVCIPGRLSITTLGTPGSEKPAQQAGSEGRRASQTGPQDHSVDAGRRDRLVDGAARPTDRGRVTEAAPEHQQEIEVMPATGRLEPQAHLRFVAGAQQIHVVIEKGDGGALAAPDRRALDVRYLAAGSVGTLVDRLGQSPSLRI